MDELADSVSAYLAAGFDMGEPGIVVATPEHADAIAEALAGHGWDEARIGYERLLLVADAEATLAALLEDGRLAREPFERVADGMLDRLEHRFPGHRIRVFGEMVDLLCRRGQPEAAFVLEDLWRSVVERRDISLLCSYELDVFDQQAQISVLPGVCRTHSHVRAGGDPDRLQRAVDSALEETLGDDIGKIYALIGDQIRDRRVPASQLALMWVSAQMPTLADRILASARARYLREPVRSVTL